MRRDVDVRCVVVELPGFDAGAYVVTLFDPLRGEAAEERRVEHRGGALRVSGVPLVADIAMALRREVTRSPSDDQPRSMNDMLRSL